MCYGYVLITITRLISPVLAREEHDADGAVPVEKGEQLGSALAVRSVERAEVVRDEAAGGLGVMSWS